MARWSQTTDTIACAFLEIKKYEEVETQRSESVRRGKGVYIPRCDDGGEPVIDFDGKVVGMISGCKSGSFVPSFILNRCMDLWRNFGFQWDLMLRKLESG